MSIDLGQILDSAQPLVESAITTMGSEWTILRNPAGKQDTVTNRTTGKAAETAPEASIDTAVPGIWVPDTGAGAQLPAGPNVPGTVEAGNMVLLPEVVDLLPRDVFLCTASRDPRLAAGRRFRVVKVPYGSAGMVRTARCEAE